MRYRLLTYLAAHPDATQRELARELRVSLGKVNYCINALMAKGWLKIRNFRHSAAKQQYIYVLTPKGIEEKVAVTADFLRIKMAEYDELRREIEKLTNEVRELTPGGSRSGR